MDTTKKYIKMCEEAEKIQKTWELKAGDCVAYPPDKQKRIPHCTEWTIEWYGENDADAWDTKELKSEWSVIWLPRQDQLQQLSGLCMEDNIILFYEFVESNKPLWNLGSMEQLWLAFVMHEKYGKMWNDEKEEWILNDP